MKYTFNNKFLKDNSKPGSYRRGYETFQKGMVEDVKFNENIVRAKVKGNFRSHYETGIKFTKAGVTKGTGLHFLAERIGVDMTETMACGDSENDLYMLKEANFAVAMGNATEQIKGICNFITLSNEESGVAYAVEKLVFEEQ